ncbi:MAG: HDOD domain-containing protein [Desulfobacterales bacterium]|nr:HDOD domain-containing protein [Desulfobacterales bacterium]
MPEASVLIEKMETMKTLPDIAVRLTRMISDDSSSLQEFEEVIRLDPTLVLRLLKIVNSPYYALASKVDSIAEAVAFVGMDNLRNLIVVDIFKHIVKSGSSDDEFNRVNLWRHSAAVGVASQMVSERIFESKGENAFLCGLIHDIGMMIEDQVEPDLLLKAYNAWESDPDNILDYENKVIGTCHTQLGYLIAKDWNLPKEVQEGIRDHHESKKQVNPTSISGIVQLAEYLVNRMEFSLLPGTGCPLPQSLLAHMHTRIREYKAVVMDLPEIIEKSDDIFGLD